MEPGETIEAGTLALATLHLLPRAHVSLSTAVLREVYEEAGLLLDYDKVLSLREEESLLPIQSSFLCRLRTSFRSRGPSPHR